MVLRVDRRRLACPRRSPMVEQLDWLGRHPSEAPAGPGASTQDVAEHFRPHWSTVHEIDD